MEYCWGGKKSKRFSPGSDFTEQIFTGEISGVDSAGVLRQGVCKAFIKKAFAQKGNNIHLVFDKVVSPSVKDCECDSRSGYQERGSQYQITGPNQRRTSNWLNALRFDQFKVAEIFEGKCLYVNDGDICYCFREENGQVTRTLIPKLLSSHMKKQIQK